MPVRIHNPWSLVLGFGPWSVGRSYIFEKLMSNSGCSCLGLGPLFWFLVYQPIIFIWEYKLEKLMQLPGSVEPPVAPPYPSPPPPPSSSPHPPSPLMSTQVAVAWERCTSIVCPAGRLSQVSPLFFLRLSYIINHINHIWSLWCAWKANISLIFEVIWHNIQD